MTAATLRASAVMVVASLAVEDLMRLALVLSLAELLSLRAAMAVASCREYSALTALLLYPKDQVR